MVDARPGHNDALGDTSINPCGSVYRACKLDIDPRESKEDKQTCLFWVIGMYESAS